MITKKILYPNEIEKLIPHWPFLSKSKLYKLSSTITRNSRYNKKIKVLDVPPILLTPYNLNNSLSQYQNNLINPENLFILNGKHRSVISLVKNRPLETIIVFNFNDLKYHTPKKVLWNLKKINDLLSKKEFYYEYCLKQNIHNVLNLYQKFKLDCFSELINYSIRNQLNNSRIYGNNSDNLFFQ